MLLVIFASCSDSIREPGESPTASDESKVYITLNLHVPASGDTTRSGFSDGEEAEYALSENLDDHFGIGFDENGNFTSIGEFISMEELEKEDTEGNVTKKVKSVIFIKKPKNGEPMLRYLFIVINGGNIKSKIEAELVEEGHNNISSLLNFQWEEEGGSIGYYNSDKRYFTMTNCIYIEDEKLAGYTDISSLYAEDEDESAVTQEFDIYVERVLAKFSVESFGEKFKSIKSGYIINPDNTLRLKTGENDPVESPYAINFIGVGGNGLEKSSYLYKKIIKDNPSSFPTVATASLPNYYNNWNDAGNHRSYWAIDANYSEGSYPKQSRRVLTPGIEISSLEVLEETSLHYRSWNDLKDNGFATVYSVENTFSGEEIDPTAYLNAATHVIFGARILIGEEIPDSPTESTLIGNVSTKYRDYNDIWYNNENNAKKGSLQSITDALSELDTQLQVPYYSQYPEVSIPENDYLSVDGSNLTIKKSIKGAKLVINNNSSYGEVGEGDFKFDKAYTLHGDGCVILAPNLIEESGETTIYMEVPDNDGSVTYVPLSANVLVSLAYHYAKTVECYMNGLMYYVVPIPHNINNSNPNNDIIGDYGVVRNHWYGLNVKKVQNLGTPIHDPAQPIVPQLDTKVVINWVVSSWSEKETTIPPFN